MSDTETAEQRLARIQSGFSKNDIIVINTFAGAGISADDIHPRQNVFTYKAWKTAGRQVAKGASGLPVTVWIPKKNKDGEKGNCWPKTTRLFHIDQTLPLDADKGLKPAAWDNKYLFREGSYTADSNPTEVVFQPIEVQPTVVASVAGCAPQLSLF